MCMSIKSHESHLMVNKGSVRGHDLTSLTIWAMNYMVIIITDLLIVRVQPIVYSNIIYT